MVGAGGGGSGGETSREVPYMNGTGHNMPGIVSRHEGTTKLSEGVKVATHVQATGEESEAINKVKLEDYSNGTTHVNLDRPVFNGNQAVGASVTTRDIQRKISSAMEKAGGQLPPEIDHITFGYVPLSSLVARLAQETFNGLQDAISDMAEMLVHQPGQNGVLNNASHQVNGHTHNDLLKVNVQKKLRMLNFANESRAKFIKVLVLSKWARHAHGVSRAIDIKVWLDQQRTDHLNAVHWIGELKRLLVHIKEPNPDIKTALEVLSLGKASWLPDLGYLPPESLSPQQFLAVLRRINILLAIRLNLHESIPPIFRDFSIASGRATFRVADEFEVDLSIADEDNSSQLYFIDFRFLFSPTPAELPHGSRLRNELEGRANDILSRDGLQGVFDFFHNFVLTHKLGVLRNQAFQMARGQWSEHIKVEPVRRSVVVQYWANRPGGKNWIEIGINRGKETRVYSLNTTQRIPRIALRWFRGGKEVAEVQFDIHLDVLSMADVLKQIIARHTSYILTEVAAKLSESVLYSGGSLRLKHTSSHTEPVDASLLIQLTVSKAIKIIQEPVSGRFAVLPASQLNSRAEFELNRLASPATEAFAQIAYLRSLASQEDVEMYARCVGWELVRSLNPSQETMQRFFPKGTQRIKFFRRQNWSPSWILAFSTSLEGDFWWVVELSEGHAALETIASSSPIGATFRVVYKIASAGSGSLAMESSYGMLDQVERIAAGIICQFNDTRHLAASRIPHRVQVSPIPSSENTTASIYIRLPFRRAPSILRSPNPLALPWANEIIKIDYRGLDPTTHSAVHIASARMTTPIFSIKDLTSAVPSTAFHPTSGAFAFQLLTKVGEVSIPTLTRRILAIERLLHFVSTIKAYKLVFNTASLDHLEFTYAKMPTSLKATIHFPADSDMYLTLNQPNPHLRVLDHLTARVRSQGLTALIAIFRLTLPLLRALSKLECKRTSNEVDVLARSEQWYQVRYSAPTRKGGFDIRLRQRRDDPMWTIPEASIKNREPISDTDEWHRALKGVTRGRGEGWRGVKGGIVASLKGIEDVVGKLDDVFGSATRVAEESRPGKRKAEGEVVEID